MNESNTYQDWLLGQQYEFGQTGIDNDTEGTQRKRSSRPTFVATGGDIEHGHTKGGNVKNVTHFGEQHLH